MNVGILQIPENHPIATVGGCSQFESIRLNPRELEVATDRQRIYSGPEPALGARQ